MQLALIFAILHWQTVRLHQDGIAASQRLPMSEYLLHSVKISSAGYVCAFEMYLVKTAVTCRVVKQKSIHHLVRL